MHMTDGMAIDVLLVDDSAGDVRLTQEAFRESRSPIRLHIARDGEEAMAFLRHESPYSSAPRPDFILLDLNLPRSDGRDVLAFIKRDPGLRTIPTVVLTSSEAEADVLGSYMLGANAVLRKRFDLDASEALMRSIDDFWFSKVKLPLARPVTDAEGTTPV
jgi:two-component system, chemotaxis family, response regulator Rcp1